jgi:hypothetical protein
MTLCLPFVPYLLYNRAIIRDLDGNGGPSHHSLKPNSSRTPGNPELLLLDDTSLLKTGYIRHMFPARWKNPDLDHLDPV